VILCSTFEFQNRIFVEFFVRVSSSNIKPFEVQGSTVFLVTSGVCIRYPVTVKDFDVGMFHLW
jgi:hypothetical protein